jgi:mRNA interferase MazF
VTPGDVVLVRFPFTELAATKKRPALLLAQTARSARHQLATVAMITSQVEGLTLPGDVRLGEWKSAGLLHPSILRLAKIATIDGDLVDTTLGHLARSDLAVARAAFKRVFAAWV